MAPTIQPFPPDSIEHKAYASVEDISFTEANDKNRLGYHVYLFLKKEIPTLKEAIHVAQARMAVSKEEAFISISARLQEMGLIQQA